MSTRGRTGPTMPGRVVLVALLLLLGGLCAIAILSRTSRGPYGSYWGPTPLGWWLLALALAALLMLHLAGASMRSTLRWTTVVLLAMAIASLCLAVAFLRQSVGLQAIVAGGALAAGVLLLRFRRADSGKAWSLTLALACLVVCIGAAACGLGLIGRSLNSYSLGGWSPDKQYRIVKIYFGPGAMGAAGEVVNIRRDWLDLMRHEKPIFYPRGTFAGTPRWAGTTTVLVDGQRVSIEAVPPVGWDN